LWEATVEGGEGSGKGEGSSESRKVGEREDKSRGEREIDQKALHRPVKTIRLQSVTRRNGQAGD